ncbi:hypothetical protein HXA32_00195 [Salipaludibacillus agaradhaerens]|nr:hypothetical protein [Salipaludibacillus agaradhaerens]
MNSQHQQPNNDAFMFLKSGSEKGSEPEEQSRLKSPSSERVYHSKPIVRKTPAQNSVELIDIGER